MNLPSNDGHALCICKLIASIIQNQIIDYLKKIFKLLNSKWNLVKSNKKDNWNSCTSKSEI